VTLPCFGDFFKFGASFRFGALVVCVVVSGGGAG